jgi:hypothetical protein
MILTLLTTLSFCQAYKGESITFNSDSDLSTDGFIVLFKRASCLAEPCSEDSHCHAKKCMNGCDTEIDKCFSNSHTSNLPYYHKNHGKEVEHDEKKTKQDSKSSSRTSPSRKKSH